METKMRTFYLDIPNLQNWGDLSLEFIQVLAETDD